MASHSSGEEERLQFSEGERRREDKTNTRRFVASRFLIVLGEEGARAEMGIGIFRNCESGSSSNSCVIKMKVE